jgi:hypothetical protein
MGQQNIFGAIARAFFLKLIDRRLNRVFNQNALPTRDCSVPAQLLTRGVKNAGFQADLVSSSFQSKFVLWDEDAVSNSSTFHTPRR